VQSIKVIEKVTSLFMNDWALITQILLSEHTQGPKVWKINILVISLVKFYYH